MNTLKKAFYLLIAIVVLIFILRFFIFHNENPYTVLSVSKYNSMSHIKRAYKDLAKKYHPDKNKCETEEETIKIRNLFYNVQAAYKTIKAERKGAKEEARGSDNPSYDGSFYLFFSMVKSTVKAIFYLILTYGIYYGISILFKCMNFLFNFFFYMCIIYSISDLFFCSFFKSRIEEYLTTILLSLIISSILYYKKILAEEKAKKEKEERNKVAKENSFINKVFRALSPKNDKRSRSFGAKGEINLTM